MRTGHVNEAIERLIELISDEQRVFGAESPETLYTRRSLADALNRAGRTGEAISELQGVLTIQERIFGPVAHETTNSRAQLRELLRTSR
jgi:hypothetical protein